MKTYSLPSGLYNLAFRLLIFMTAIPLAVSPVVFRTVIDPRAERVEPGFHQVAIATIFLGYMSIELVTTEEGVSTRITHAKGKLSIPEQMGDLSELVSFLTSRNPRIEVTRATS